MQDYRTVEGGNIGVGEWEQPKKGFCKKNCGWKAVVCYIVSALVFVVIGALIAYIGFYVLSKGDVCDVPKLVCTGASPSTEGFYNVKKDFGALNFQYLYAANFVTDHTIKFNDTNLDIGTLNLCVQTTGSKIVSPKNCSLNYSYDHSTCAFHYLNGDCDQAVSHQFTDNNITAIQFLPDQDNLLLDFFSHSHITGGTYRLTKGDLPVITCDPVTGPVPDPVCGPKQPASFFDRLENFSSDSL